MAGRSYESILFVAPDDKTLRAVVPEEDALYQLGFRVRTLQGEVTDDRLFEAVRSQRYDVLHFAAHSAMEGTGVQLTYAPFTFGGLQQVARLSGANLVFLNLCGSASTAQRLVNGGLPAAIGTFGPIGDTVAKQGAMAFYQELARTQDPHAAYCFAYTGEHYGWFANGNYAAMMREPIERMSRGMRWLIGVSVANGIGLLTTLVVLLRHMGIG